MLSVTIHSAHIIFREVLLDLNGRLPATPNIRPSTSRLPSKGRYPNLLRKRQSLLPGLVRRPRHLPLQPRSPERSTHDSLSIYRNAELFRTRHTSLLDSTDKLRRPAGQPHYSSIYPTQITRTSSKRGLSQSYTFESHNNSLYSDYTRNNINSRTILQNRNTNIKQLYIYISKHVCSLQEHTSD